MFKMRDLLRGTYFSMSHFHEQREFERVKVNTAISLYHGTPPHITEAICVNISTGGMGVMTDQVIPMGSECKVKIHDGKTNQREYQALVEIVRIVEIDETQFFLGARILIKY